MARSIAGGTCAVAGAPTNRQASAASQAQTGPPFEREPGIATIFLSVQRDPDPENLRTSFQETLKPEASKCGR
jgi:hypothetical protein